LLQLDGRQVFCLLNSSTDNMLKAVILIGGPQKGTRFRPLSFEVPKPLFPVAGVPMLQHHIEACVKVSASLLPSAVPFCV
ncbi:hypothetical protein XENOCAPTIV_027551, partial [Xenoophorus captivus]